MNILRRRTKRTPPPRHPSAARLPFGIETLESRRILSASPIGGERLVHSDFINGNQDTFESDAIAYRSDGGFTVVYAGKGNGDSHGVFARQLDSAGIPLGAGVLVNQTTSSTQSSPSIATLGDHSIVVWSGRGAGDSSGVFMRRLDANSLPLGSETLVNQTVNGTQEMPVVAALVTGGFTIAWRGKGPGDSDGIFVRRFAADGTPTGGETLVNTTTPHAQRNPSISARPDGGFLVAWDGLGANDSSGVFLRQFDPAGNPIGPERRVNTTTQRGQENPAVALDAAGRFVVAWNGAGPGDFDGVFLQRFDAAGSPIGGEQRVNTHLDREQESPSVSMAADGRSVVTWSSRRQDGDNWGVYAQEYDPNGIKVGPEFLVNNTIRWGQRFSSVEVTSAGGYTIAWSGNGAGDNQGVFARSYGNPNSTPRIEQSADQSIREGETLTFSATATDLNDPPGSLVFSLDVGAPAGAAIDPATGEFTWTPTENQGPGNFTISARVTDPLGASDATAFQVIVDEVNSPPSLDPISNQIVEQNRVLVLMTTAADPDLPANRLSFSLEPGAPFGSTIDAASGLFRWTPSLLDIPGDYPTSVRVTDNGTPPLSATNAFTVTVLPEGDNDPPTVTAVLANDTGPVSFDEDGITSDPTVSGRVTDVSPIVSLRAWFDDSPPGSYLETIADLQPDGTFTLSAARIDSIAGGTLTNGTHTLHVIAVDQRGNMSTTIDVPFVLDTVPPTISVTSPTNGGSIGSGARLTGTVIEMGSTLGDADYRIDAHPSLPLLLDNMGAFDQTLSLENLLDGPHELNVTASDIAGNIAIQTRNILVVQPFRILQHSPFDGGVEVGSTFRPQIFFSKPVNPATLTSDTFFATFAGAKLAANIVPANDGTFAWLFFTEPMPSSARIEVTVTGDVRAMDGQMLDGDRDGTPGGSLTFGFKTVSLVPIPGTRLLGQIVDPGPDRKPHTEDDSTPGPDGQFRTEDDTYLLPIAGVKVYLLGLEDHVVFTDNEGRFHFDAVPVGNVKVDTDGRTALHQPPGFYFPDMVMDANMRLGENNFVMPGMEVMYLPRLANGILQTVSNASGATMTVPPDGAPELTPEQRQLMSITVAPGSIIGPGGAALSQAQIGISTVPPELVRDMLPPGILKHSFDITVQAMGVETFSTPAAMTLPNVFNAPVGTKLNLLSFDHTTGRLVIEGTGTVSADGLSIRTDPGTGVTHPGWHGWVPPGTTSGGNGPSGPPGGNPPCGNPGDPDEMAFPKTRDLKSHFFMTDDGEVRFMVGNLFSEDTDKRPCPNSAPGVLHVEFKYDDTSIADQFLMGIPKANITLGPEQTREISFKVKQLLQDVHKMNADRLYGVKMTLRFKTGKGRDLGSSHIHIYRFVDAADAEHEDRMVDMADTSVGITRRRKIETHFGPESLARFEPVDASVFGSEGNASAFTFSPNAKNQKTENDRPKTEFKLMTVAENTEIMPNNNKRLKIQGDGEVHTWSVNTGNLAQEFMAIAQAIPGFSRLLQDPQLIASRVVQAINDLITATFPMVFIFNDADGESIRIANFATPADEVSTNNLGDSGTVDANKGTLEQLTIFRNAYSDAEGAFRLSETINEKFGGGEDVEIYLRKVLDLRRPQTESELTTSLAQVIVHEILHKLGIFHTRDFHGRMMSPFRGFGPDQFRHDIMSQGGTELVKNFAVSNFAARVALGMDWDVNTFDTTERALDYYDAYFKGRRANNLDSNIAPAAFGLGEVDEDELVSFNGPILRIQTDPDRILVQGSYGTGTVIVDGVGGQLAEHNLVLANIGEQTLTIESAQLRGLHGDIVISSISRGTTIDPGADLPLQLTFDPTSSGAVAAQLIVENNALNGDYIIDISGFGLSPVGDLRFDVLNNNLQGDETGDGIAVFDSDFGALKNIGDSPLTITQVAFIDDSLGQFSVLGLPAGFGPGQPLVLQPGAMFSLGVAFAAQATGLQRATLAIFSDDPETPMLRQTAVGTGTLNGDGALFVGQDFVALELPFEEGAPVFRQKSDEGGNWEFVMPPRTPLRYLIFDPQSGLIGQSHDVSNVSGARVIDRLPVFGASSSTDSDGDGLPDDIEFSIGSSNSDTDTDNDGLDDFLEIQLGGDPLGGQGLPSGVIASAMVPGVASEVVVEASPTDLRTPLVYVASAAGNGADGGLFVIDISSLTQPVIIGAATLGGLSSDVAVDTNLQVAAVTAGANGLHLVDVGNPQRPLLRTTLQLPNGVGRVETYNGRAYVTSAASLIRLDLATGTVLQSLPLGGTDLTDVTRDGTTLFTYDTANTIRAIDMSGDMMVARGAVNVPSLFQGGRLFAGDGIVYATAAAFAGAPGFATINATNLDLLTLISGVDNQANSFAFNDLAASGSGLLATVGAQIGQPPSFDVINVSDPSVTDNFVTRFATRGLASGVAMGNGVALVAGGNTGMQVVNFRQIDTLGVAPTVAVASPAPDVDLQAAGTQVDGNSLIPVFASVTEDIQTRDVELLVDGMVVARDLSYPFDFQSIAPNVSAPTQVRLQVRATDTAGNASLSNVLLIDVLPSNPHVIDIVPIPGSNTAGDVDEVLITFDRVIDASMLVPADFPLVGDGVDNTFGTMDDVPLSLDLLSLNTTGTILSLRLNLPLAGDTYRVSIPADKIHDLAGNPLDGEFAGLFPTGDGVPRGDTVFAFTVTAASTGISDDAFPVPRLRMVQLADNEKLDDRFTSINGTAVDRRGNSDVLVADLNNDGRPDLARASFGTIFELTASGTQSRTFNAVEVRLQRPDGSYDDPVDFTVGAHPRATLAGDVNGDTKLDLVTVNVADSANGTITQVGFELSVLLGDGTGDFAPEIRVLTGRTVATNLFEPPQVALGRFTNDTHLDIAVLMTHGAPIASPFFNVETELLVLAGNGDGTFQSPVTGSTQTGSAFTRRRELFSGDINGDTFLDLITPEHVLINDGAGMFSAALVPGAAGTRVVSAADVTGDNKIDLLTELGAGNVVTLTLLQNDGVGSFTSIPSSALQGHRSNGGGIVADVNNDSRPDWLTPNPTFGVSVHLANADWTFQRFAPLPMSAISGTARPFVNTVAADLDGNGTRDLVMTRQGDEAVIVATGRGDGTFHVPLVTLPRIAGPGSFPNLAGTRRLIDMTGDGLLDLVGNGRTSASSSVELFLVFAGNGDGTFDPAVVTSPARLFFSIGMMDAGSVPDVVSTDAFGNVVLLRGLGTGAFSVAEPIGTLGYDGFSNFARAIQAVDATGDGKFDVAILHRRGMTILPGNGDGTFGAPVETLTALTMERNFFSAVDLNNDNRADFLVPRADGLRVLLSNADGTVTDSGSVGTPPVGMDHRIASGDFDENGSVDIALITNANQVGFVGQLLVFPGNGNGTFGPANRVAVDDFTDVRAADIDGDGNLDLITGGLHEVAIHAGPGDGMFQSAVRFDLSGPQTSFPTDIHVGDLTSDGRLDIVGYAFVLPQAAAPLPAVQAAPAGGLLPTQPASNRLNEFVNDAVRRLRVAGVLHSRLDSIINMRMVISDLPGRLLGLATNDKTTIDTDAAGLDWLIDATPSDDREFTWNRTSSVLSADATAESGRIDLLTVVTHELGYHLGLFDTYDTEGTTDLRFGRFEPGVRRLLSDSAIDSLLADPRELDELLPRRGRGGFQRKLL